MSRRVDRERLNEWVEENGPNGIAKLSVASGVSLGTLAKVRLGHVPKAYTRRLICKSLGLAEDTLFPILPDGEERAS